MSASALLSYQSKWVGETAQIALFEKSRRIGASWAEACIDTLMASRAGKDGCDTLYCCYNEDATRTFINDCAFWAKTFNLVASQVEEVILKDEDKDILAFRITFASGYEIKALSSNPVNIRGKAGRVVIDEAGHVPDLSAMVNAAIALLMWGGQLRIIGTHNGVDSSFNKMILDIKSGRLNYALHTTTLDDALEDGLYQRICLMTNQIWSLEKQLKWRQDLIAAYPDEEKALEELFCVPASSSRLFLNAMLVQSRMRAEYQVSHLKLPDSFIYQLPSEKRWKCNEWLESEIKPALIALNQSERHYFGEDFGRFMNLTCIAVIAERQDLSRYCPLLVELENVPQDQQQQILEYIVRRLPNFGGGAMDAGGNGFALAEYAANTFGHTRIAQIKLSDKDYQEMAPLYKKALEDDAFQMPKNANILADHQAVRIINGVAKVPKGTINKGDDGDQRHGDSFIALMLGVCAAIKRPFTPIVEPVPVVQQNSRKEGREIFVPAALGIGRAAAKGIFR